MNRTQLINMDWKSFYTLTLGAVIFPVLVVGANIPIPTRAEWAQWMRMKDMYWLPILSAEQVDTVRSALGSKYNPLVEAALTNVILHGLDNLLPIIEVGVNTPKRAAVRPFREMCAEVLNFGGNPFVRLREILKKELPGDEFISNCQKMDYCRPVRHMVTSLIVVEEVRAVRAQRKKEPDVRGLELSQFETELVRSSRLSAGAAVRATVDELSKVRVITPRETVLIQVLQTYSRDKYVGPILQRLETPGAIQSYGKVVLLRSLRFQCAALDNEHVAKLRSIIDSIRQTEPSPSLENAVSALESELE